MKRQMNDERINCSKCYAPMDTVNGAIGVCDACAKKEVQALSKRIRISFVVSAVFIAAALLICHYARATAFTSELPEYDDAVLIPVLFGHVALSTRAFHNIFYPTLAGGTIFLLICFFVPFSSFITIEYNTYRHQAETNLFKSGLVFRDIASANSHRMDDVGLFIVSLIISVLSGPFFFVYRFYRLARLRKHLASGKNAAID